MGLRQLHGAEVRRGAARRPGQSSRSDAWCGMTWSQRGLRGTLVCWSVTGALVVRAVAGRLRSTPRRSKTQLERPDGSDEKTRKAIAKLRRARRVDSERAPGARRARATNGSARGARRARSTTECKGRELRRRADRAVVIAGAPAAEGRSRSATTSARDRAAARSRSSSSASPDAGGPAGGGRRAREARRGRGRRPAAPARSRSERDARCADAMALALATRRSAVADASVRLAALGRAEVLRRPERQRLSSRH